MNCPAGRVGFLGNFYALFVHILFQVAEGLVQVQDVKNLLSLFLQTLVEQIDFLFWNVLEAVNATRVEHPCIRNLIICNKVLAHLPNLIKVDEFLVKCCTDIAFWIPLDVRDFDLDENIISNRFGCFCSLCEDFRFRHIFKNFMVDILVMSFTYFEPSDLALLHSQERVSEKVESLFVSYHESISHFALF